MLLIYQGICTSESPLTGIHSAASSKLFTCIFNSQAQLMPLSRCWASPFSALFPVTQLTGTQLYSDYRLLLGAHDVFTPVPGAGPGLINHSRVPAFLSQFAHSTRYVTGKKKYSSFFMGEKQILMQTLMCFTKKNTFPET